MTEEFRNDSNEACFCKSKGFRHFLASALGSFVGVFFAISLFCALHKPPMMMPQMPMYNPGFHAHRGCDCPCHKMMMKKFFKEEFARENKIDD